MKDLQDLPQIYTQGSDIQWPSDYASSREYLTSLLSSGPQTFLDNLQTRVFILKAAEQIFPLTVNEKEYDNSYICSPYTRYVTYAKREMFVLHNRWHEMAWDALLNNFGMLLKSAGINKVVAVNNWLLSTNLYPDVSHLPIKQITQALLESFSEHAIMFPSLTWHSNGPLMKQLAAHNYQLVPTREVFIFDKNLKDYENRRITKTDFDLLKKTSYQVVTHEEITENDYERIARLYHFLYVEKYSYCNPIYTPAFIQVCYENKVLNFNGLRDKSGELVGFIASYHRNGVMATPLVGYDTRLSTNEGIYRILTALSLKEALENNLIFNMSAGVSEFKKWRGGVGFIEYSAVYCEHLPFYRKKMWELLRYMMNQLGVYCLHKYRF